MTNEDDMRAATRQRVTKFRWAVWLCLIGIGMTGAGFAFGLGRSGDAATGAGVLAGVGAVFVLGGAIVAWVLRPGNTRWWAEQTSGGKRDRLQAQRTRQLTVIPALSLIFLAQAVTSIENILAGEVRWVDLLRVAVPVLYAWVSASIVMGWDGAGRKNRRFLEDELTQAHRARALVAAFFVLLAGGTMLLGVGLWRAEVAVAAMPVLLAAGGATAGLRFAWLDREASRTEIGEDRDDG